MPAPLKFYFDFISPYGYFASLRIEELAKCHGRDVDWRAMLLGVSVLKVMGLKPLLETPLKADYVKRDVLRYARRHGVELKRDLDAPVGNPLAMGRAFWWVKQQSPALAVPLAHAIYRAFWVEGRDLSAPKAVCAIDLPAGIDAKALLDALQDGDASALLRHEVQASLDAGIFGSPTIVVDGEPFWGVERLSDVEEWLASGGW